MVRNTRSRALSHPPIFTVGHGTRTLDDLIQLLQTANITKLVDIRSIPRSFTNPQFNRDTLQESVELQRARIEYVWFGESLGGRRNAKQPTLAQHTAIRVAAFRNYAGYMSTPSFKEGLAELQHLAEELHSSREGYVAIMCSETLWWRCHRRMVSDALVTEGWNIQHLGVAKRTMEHTLWDIARVHEGSLIYDGRERQHTKKRKAPLGDPAATEK